MSLAIALARARGLRIGFTDLGEWGSHRLCSEYDAQRGEIRINLRIAERLDPETLRTFVALAVGHELYHHREHVGEIAVLSNTAARESAADAFARGLLAPAP